MSRRGASLVWVVIICSVMMTVATTITSAIVKESQMGVRMDDSAKAYAAAESGLEWARWCLGNAACTVSLGTAPNNYPAVPYTGSFVLGDTEYTVKIESTGGTANTIRSVGRSHGVNREIEYKTSDGSGENIVYGRESLATQEIDDLDKTFNVATDGFTMSFDYWKNPSSSSTNRLVFGDVNTGDAVEVDFAQNGSDVTVDLRANDATTAIVNSAVPAIKLHNSSPYTYANRGSNRIYLYYSPNVAAKIEVYSVTGSGPMTCVGTKTVMFSGAVTIDEMKVTTPAWSTVAGDNPYYKIVSSGDSFDNFYETGLTPNVTVLTSFPGFQNIASSYRYLTLYDYDNCRIGGLAGITEGGLSYKVDGHVKYELVRAADNSVWVYVREATGYWGGRAGYTPNVSKYTLNQIMAKYYNSADYPDSNIESDTKRYYVDAVTCTGTPVPADLTRIYVILSN